MAGRTVLLVDVGNTRSTLALSHRKRIGRPFSILASEASFTAMCALLEELSKDREISGGIIGSVVPKLTKRWQRAIKQSLGRKALVVSHKLDLGLELHYPRPECIGADRIANAVSAKERYGVPVVVADFGTALTFDIISTRGYEGGIIAPGLPLMFSYLAERTALLPQSKPLPVRGVVGKSTISAMSIGARYGYRGMVRELFTELCQQLGEPRPVLCATGGDAAWVLKGLDLDVQYDKHLTLRGLLIMYVRNSEL